MAGTDLALRIRADADEALQEVRELTGETDKLGKEVDQTGRRFGRFGRDLGGVTGKIQRAKRGFDGLRTAAVGLASVFAGGVLAQQIGQTLSALEDTQRQARSLNVEVERFQEIQFAFRQFGLASNDITDALSQIADRAKDAIQGAKGMQEDFALLGLEVDDLRGKRPDELFELVARRIESTNDTSTQAAAAVRLFGDEIGQKLLPLLQGAEGGIDGVTQRARELGIVMDDELVDASTKAARSTRELKEVFSAQFQRAIAGNADSFEDLADTLSSEDFQEGLSSLVSGFESLANFGSDVTSSIGNAATELERLNALVQGEPLKTEGQLRAIENRIAERQETLREISERQPDGDGFFADVKRTIGPDFESQKETVREELELLKQRREVLEQSGALAEDAFTELVKTDDLERRVELARRLSNFGAARFVPQQLRERAGIRLDRSDAVGAPVDIGSQGDFVAKVQQDVNESNETVSVPAKVDLSIPDPLAGVGRFSVDELAAPTPADRFEGESTEEFVQRQQRGFTTPESEARGRRVAEAFGINNDRVAEDQGLNELQASLPPVQRDLEELKEQANETEEATSQFAIQSARNIQNTLGREISSVIQEADSLEDAFKRIADSIVSTVAETASQIAAQNLAEAAFGNPGESGEIGGFVGDLFSGFGGGSGGDSGGGLFGSVASFASSFFHEGGIAGAGNAPTANIPAAAFADAPHFNTGGIAGGLRDDEIPSVLHRGEEVLTRDDPRHRANGGGGMTFIQQINGVRDKEEFELSRAEQRRRAQQLTRGRG